MALKLSKDLKTKETPKTAFDIHFKPGAEYDLDEIVSLRTRDNPDSPLSLKLISVKDEDSKNILKKILRDVDVIIYEDLLLGDVEDMDGERESVKGHISNIIVDTYKDFGYIVGEEIHGDRYEMVFSAINRKVTKYLNSLTNKFKLDYKVTVGEKFPELIITYNLDKDFVVSEEFTKILVEYYNIYSGKMNNLLIETEEGGLSLEGGEERVKKISPTQSDYKKYLLN